MAKLQGRRADLAGGAWAEDLRNRLLRRADWRFLLPAATATKSICFADGPLAEAVALISGQVVDPRGERARGECDLAVAVDPDGDTLRTAWDVLRPDGWCYTEWYSLLYRQPRGVRKRLERAGFEVMACYWPRPSPAAAPSAVWLPLGAPGALRYLRTKGTDDRPVGRRLRRLAGHLKWLLVPWMRLAVPICAVARKPARGPTGRSSRYVPPTRADIGPAKRSGANESIIHMIRAHWETWGFGHEPARLSWLLQTGGHTQNNKVIALVFAEPDARPRLLVKMARVSEAAAGVSREAACLRTLEAGARRLAGVPRIIFEQDVSGLLAVGQSFLTGKPVRAALRPDTYRDLALKATDWLVRLAGNSPSRPRENWWSRLVEPVLTEFEATYGGSLDPGLLREASTLISGLYALPIVPEHGDVSPENVLIGPDEELAVLDWEAAELEGLPAVDLIYFLTFCAFGLDRAWTSGRLRSYRASLNPSSLTNAVAAECLARYARGTGLALQTLGPLRLLLWMAHALWSHGRRALGRPHWQRWDGTVFMRLWEEDLRTGAF